MAGILNLAAHQRLWVVRESAQKDNFGWSISVFRERKGSGETESKSESNTLELIEVFKWASASVGARYSGIFSEESGLLEVSILFRWTLLGSVTGENLSSRQRKSCF